MIIIKMPQYKKYKKLCAKYRIRKREESGEKGEKQNATGESTWFAFGVLIVQNALVERVRVISVGSFEVND